MWVVADNGVCSPRNGAYDTHSSLALGSRGARASEIGVASHHHTAAIEPRDSRRSASGVRKVIGSILVRRDRRLTGRSASAKSGKGQVPGQVRGQVSTYSQASFTKVR